MWRRAFLVLACAAIPWAEPAPAQQPALPVVGFLRSTPAAPFANIVSAFRRGLAEAGYVEGRNVEIAYRWANNDLSRLPVLAAELVQRPVRVIVGNSQAVEAASAATTTIPIVFVTSDDPIERGLVESYSRPEGNLTGITFFGVGALGAKRVELLRELVPSVRTVAVLNDPAFGGTAAELADAEEAARALGLQLIKVEALSEADLEPAFAKIKEVRADALLAGGSPVFTSRRERLVALADRYALPAIYDQRDIVAAGGLISYAASFTDAYRHAGVYAGRILGGAKVSELPVLQPAKFELVVNARAAKRLGLEIPRSILLRADEVIE